MNPGSQALKMVIAAILRRRALWKVQTIQDFFDLNRETVIQRIEAGEYAWAFNIGTGKGRREIRVLAYSVVEGSMGTFDGVGATRNLKLPEVIDLILPQRDIRSTELRRRLSCDHGHVYSVANHWKVTQKPAAKDGPKAFTVFSRASVARWLSSRRIT